MIKKLYFSLFKHFGPRGWWPTTPSHSSHPLYSHRKSLKKLTEQESFEICLGAILTQNTSWSNVERVLSGLKKNKLLNFRSLLAMPLQKLEIHLRSSGYFRQKSFRVRSFLKTIQKETKGRFKEFLQGSLSPVREKLLRLHGIGPETADSMMLYAAGHPIFVVDAYTRRIASRWGIIKGDESYEEIQATFMKALPRSASLFGEYHALLVELGKEFCQKKPLCKNCPLCKVCKNGRKETA